MGLHGCWWWGGLLLLRRCRSGVEAGRLRQLLLLLLLLELRLVLLRNSRHRRGRPSLKRLLLRGARLKWLLLRGASLEWLLLGSASLEWLLLGSRLAWESGELRLELPRSLRPRLLEAWVARILLLESRGSLAEARRLGGKGAGLLLLLAWLLPRLAERAPILLLSPGAKAISTSQKGVGLGIHRAVVVGAPMASSGREV